MRTVSRRDEAPRLERRWKPRASVAVSREGRVKLLKWKSRGWSYDLNGRGLATQRFKAKPLFSGDRPGTKERGQAIRLRTNRT